MRLRNIPGSREAIAASGFVVHEDVMKEKRGAGIPYSEMKSLFL